MGDIFTLPPTQEMPTNIKEIYPPFLVIRAENIQQASTHNPMARPLFSGIYTQHT